MINRFSYRVWLWDNDNWGGKYLDDDVVIAPDGEVATLNNYSELEDDITDKSDVEMFTGIYDINGKPVYAGDIVKTSYKYAQPKVSQVIIEDGNTYLVGEDLATGNEMLLSDHIDEIEVIGNVHENSELLEEDRDD